MIRQKIVNVYDRRVEGRPYRVVIRVYDDDDRTLTADWWPADTPAHKYTLGYGIQASAEQLELEVDERLKSPPSTWPRA